MAVSSEEFTRISAAAGADIVAAKPLSRVGYTNNRHWIVELADGRSIFAKLATDQAAANWLRREHARYGEFKGPWMPELFGWYDDGELPALLLEDLSGCPWPPPWTPDRIDMVLGTLAEVARLTPPAGLTPVSQTSYGQVGWPSVAAEPEPFLSLGLCTSKWLDRVLPQLLSAAQPECLDGDSVVHLDVRSDNMFFRDTYAVLVDWNLAAIGNPEFDVAFWLPSLRLEGGPEPEAVLRPRPEIAALVAGFFAARAGLPNIPEAPRVRKFQREQLEVALPWALRALELPTLDL